MSITYLKIEGESLVVTHRIFKDDLELAIRQFTNDTEALLDTSSKLDVVNYLWEVTSLEIDQERAQTTLQSFDIEGSGPTCTVECTFIVDLTDRPKKKFTFDSRLLLDQYDDQINMVHFISPEGRKSQNLDAKITSLTIMQ